MNCEDGSEGAHGRASFSRIKQNSVMKEWAESRKAEVLLEVNVIYDADGSLFGEIVYAAKKLLGWHCSACHITHGPKTEKEQFLHLRRNGWGSADVRNLHRDEMDPDLLAFVHRSATLPCVVAKTSRKYMVLLTREDLDECDGSVPCFQRKVNSELARHSILIPDRDSFDYSEIFANTEEERAVARLKGSLTDEQLQYAELNLSELHKELYELISLSDGRQRKRVRKTESVFGAHSDYSSSVELEYKEEHDDTVPDSQLEPRSCALASVPCGAVEDAVVPFNKT